MKNLLIVLIAVFCFGIWSCQRMPEKPNIVYILADDLGYGDLGSYGQKMFETPNLDRMAAEGMRFLQHYSGSTVCAPSRSCLMTGMHTGHTYIRGNREWQPEGQWPIADSVLTVAEILQDAGYITGAFGKWGLGFVGTEGDPNKQGFDEFFGYNCQRIAHNYYPFYLWHNDRKIILEGNRDTLEQEYAPGLIHTKALEFIEKHKDESFFLYYPSVIPHAELKVPEEYLSKYRGKYLPEKTYQGTDSGPNYKMGGYGSQDETHAAFAGMVDYLDNTVGEVLDKLVELGLEKKTIVFFSSDNGPHLEGGADPKYFDSNGIFKGFKRDLYEGGIRVPLLVWWPEKVKAGQVSDHIGAFWDMMPTFTDLAGLKAPDNIDGISMVPAIMQKGKQEEHDYLYWEFHERNGRVAVLKGPWKGVKYQINANPNQPLELYNLEDDPGEENNVADDYPEIVQELNLILTEARYPSEIFESAGLDRK
jgi:arylsulfatase A